jgi:Family of unknown function (DUF5701)
VAAEALDQTQEESAFHAGAEFDRQLATLLELGYPTLAGMTERSFNDRVTPLRNTVVGREAAWQAPSSTTVPFVLVVSKRLVTAEQAMSATNLSGKPGFVSADTADVHRFEPIDSVRLPEDDVYLALDLERGDEYLNWSPDEALPDITGRGRTPLTVDEGIALFTHFPETVEKNRCYMLLGSRCGDRRVPALWISRGTGKDGAARRGAPKLGWCWAGNRHTWLGHASCGRRLRA